jgi:hypothetical protein
VGSNVRGSIAASKVVVENNAKTVDTVLQLTDEIGVEAYIF